MTDVPVFINCRDRVRDLRRLVKWLERAGHERIILIDNASTWPPLLDYLAETPHRLIRLGENLGSRSIWRAGLAPNEPFVFTDPDVVPISDCPPDAVEHLQELLDRYLQYPKAGLGLFLDDVPATMSSLAWERSRVDPRLAREAGHPVYKVGSDAFAGDTMVDTTFALHRPGMMHTLRGIRCGYPYQARHSSWYVREPDAEDRYYLEHAIQGPAGSSWAQGHQRAA